MNLLQQHLEESADWIVKCFATENMTLNYSLDSLKYVDKFLEDNVVDGKPRPNGILHNNYEDILYGLGIYLGETLKKVIVNSNWISKTIEEQDLLTGEFLLPNGTVIFPLERINKRFANGDEDSIYPYALILATQITKKNYWAEEKNKSGKTKIKSWWKFW